MTKRKLACDTSNEKVVSPAKRRTRRERQNTEFHIFRETAKRTNGMQKVTPTLLEQVREKTKLYETNVKATQDAFLRELLPMISERKRLARNLGSNPENVAIISRKDSEIKNIAVRLQYLQSGEAAKQLAKYTRELDKRSRMIASVPEKKSCVAETRVEETNDIDYVKDISCFDLEPNDPLFSHLNVDNTNTPYQNQTSKIARPSTLNKTPVPNELKKKHSTNNDVFLSQFSDPQDRAIVKNILDTVTESERQSLIRTLDVAYAIDPVMFALTTSDIPSQVSMSTLTLEQSAGMARHHNLCTSCRQPMQMNSDINVIFCLYCGVQRMAAEYPPSHFEDSTKTKSTSTRTKEDAKITCVLGNRQMVAMTNLASSNFVEAVRSAQDFRCIRSRELVHSATLKGPIKAHNIASKAPSAKHQMATYLNGVPPVYFSREDETLLTTEMKKEPRLINEMRTLNQRARSGQPHPWVSGTAQEFLELSQSSCMQQS